jgi:cell shape-determining protein MreD
LCIRKLNLNPSNILIFFLGILNDIITSVNLGISSIFFLLIKLLTENLSIFRLNDNNQQAWLSFTIVFSLSFFIIILLNIVINLSFFDINPLLFHMGTTLIFFPIINAGFDLIFFISRLIKTDS